MVESFDTIIVGGGQAGLATSYFLKKAGYDHIIFDKAEHPAQVWRNRWDSFTLITPNWMVKLPGAEYHGKDPDAFMARDEIVAYFESYITQFNLPIRYEIFVSSVTLNDGTYLVHTNEGDFCTKNVVIATGLYQMPKIPGVGKNLNANINLDSRI